ncbi:hypothetical protein CONCODRAFT_12510 [Conidiobolus coronatus NRRL 28638]|uniref:F-box domain-containing protein n=1 Tax=Conidiobolus coronatus (strain ATCC 28846 / CBS 209.66 / NRRL 28638) TaxID=796925 RepID=A0A137NSR1_CONC2|nr:hypothetical protein CONCODRAFT_12510 [Conidiobolus coronatus NRRL 28638]|eukprot:KXN65805.1 hypothetical protein CONCODRAFT_12510 [Conidiobolus coronatus NRRL 28638]
MTRVLRSASKKVQPKVDQEKKLAVSKKSKVIKKGAKKTKINSKDVSSNPIWNINPVMSTIFSYVEHKDLIAFNSVCKKWNQLTSPIIHRSIKLLSEKFDKKKLKGRKANIDAKVSAEIKKCIDNNSKFAPLVKEFNYNYRIEPKVALQFFDVFKFIKVLTLQSVTLTQDQFLSMINPLKQLEELNLRFLDIKKMVRNRIYTQPIKLPSSLTKLNINRSNFNDIDIIIETINSHTNLKKFRIYSGNKDDFLIPFYSYYPSLEYLDFSSTGNGEKIFKIIETNSQLKTLKVSLSTICENLTRHIENNLVNLENLSLVSLRKFFNYIPTESLNFCKQFKLKKLEVLIDYLNESSFANVLNCCPYLEDLTVQLPETWDGLIKVLKEKCLNLKALTIIPSFTVYKEVQHELLEEFGRDELYNNKSIINTLTHLTIKHFKFIELKHDYFKNFKNLQSIKFPIQWKYDKVGEEIDKKTKLWKNYTLRKVESRYMFDVELIKY